MKTYSLVFYKKYDNGESGWVYNYYQNFSLDEFDREKLFKYIQSEKDILKIAYQYCHDSKNAHPKVNKKIVFEKDENGNVIIRHPELLNIEK